MITEDTTTIDATMDVPGINPREAKPSGGRGGVEEEGAEEGGSWADVGGSE